MRENAVILKTGNLYKSRYCTGLFWIGVLACGSVGAATYDLKADWSDSSNPNGVWAYREGLNALPPVADWTPLNSPVTQPAWSRLGTNPNYLPSWFKSASDNPAGLDFLTDDVVVHSTDTFRGPMGIANVTWTSPVNTTIDISGEAWMVRDIGRGNTWQLSLNGDPFTDGYVSSGDPYGRANPFDFAAGSGGPSALSGIAVSIGDEIRLDLIADLSEDFGDFVGVNLTITTQQAPQFDDVPPGYWAVTSIQTLAARGVTSGCGGGNFCPDDSVTRAQMAVFLERGMRGSDFIPPPATGNAFLDVDANDFAAGFIEQLSLDGITTGCDGTNYCPGDEVTRAQMAVFLLRAEHGAGYTPPPPMGDFPDVDLSHWAGAWIEQLAAEGITSGCGGGNFCPDDSVTRAQMAVFIVRTFGL